MRLTKAIKDQIVDNVLKTVIKPKEQELDKENQGLAARAYNVLYSEKDRELLMNAPDEAFVKKDSFRVEYVVKGGKGGEINLFLNCDLPFFYAHCGYYSSTNVSSDRELNTDIVSHIQFKREVHKARTDLQREVYDMLNSVTTVKRLREVWPECDEYLPAEQPKFYPPVVQGDKINSMIKNLKGE